MKIENDRTGNAGGAANVTPARLPNAGKTQRDDAARETEDSVGISAALRHAGGDSEKVERLREAVRSGTYSVPSSEIAARLIGEHLDDSGSQKAE